MARRTRWIIGTAWVDVLLLGLTVHAQANFHAAPGGQSTSLGIVVGWIAIVATSVLLALLVAEARRVRLNKRAAAQAKRRT